MAQAPLFGEAFISDVCLGLDSEETARRFEDGVEAMKAELLDSVRAALRANKETAKYAEAVTIVNENGEFVVGLDPAIAEEILSLEFGGMGKPPTSVLRNGLRNGFREAQKAFDETVRGLR